jgi:hypothetical protein
MRSPARAVAFESSENPDPEVRPFIFIVSGLWVFAVDQFQI